MKKPIVKSFLEVTSFEIHNDGSVDVFFNWGAEPCHIYSNVKWTEMWANNKGHLSGYDLDGNSYEISLAGFMEVEFNSNEIALDLVKFILKYNYKVATKIKL